MTTLAMAIVFTPFSWLELDLHSSDYFKESVSIESIYCPIITTSLKFYLYFNIIIIGIFQDKGDDS